MQPPTLGGLGFSKRAPRVAPWGTSGWELPARRKWYEVNLGRRPRPGQTGLLGCRALASCRRGEDSAANRLLPARTWAGEKVPQRSLGQKPRTGHVLTPRGVAEAPRGWPAPTLGRIQHQCRGVSFGSRSLRRKYGFPADVPEVGGRCVFRPHRASQMFAHVQRAADPVSPPRWRTDRRPVGTQRRSGVGP